LLLNYYQFLNIPLAIFRKNMNFYVRCCSSFIFDWIGW